MNLIIPCPHCREDMQLPEEYLGREVRCPRCRESFRAQAAANRHGVPEPEPLHHDAAPQPTSQVPEPRLPEVRARRLHPRPVPDDDLRPRSRRVAHLDSKMGPGAKILIGAVCVFFGIVVVIAVVSEDLNRPAPVGNVFLPVEDDAALQALKDAFPRQAPLDAEQIAAEVKPLFERLGAALRGRNQVDAADAFDLQRMYEQLQELNVLPAGLLASRRDFVAGLRLGIGNALVKQAALLEWTDVEVKSVKKLQGNEAVVFVRHRTPDGSTLKFRWWVTRRPGVWKIYDFEDLDMGLRFSATVGTLTQGGLGRLNQLAQHVQILQDAIFALVLQQNDVLAEDKLRAVRGVPLPSVFDAVRHMVQGLIHLQRRQEADALASFDNAGRVQPDMPCLDLLKAIAHSNLGQFEEALAHLDAYRKLLGDDAVTLREVGIIYAGLGRADDALAAYRQSLDQDPKNLETFTSLLHALRPQDRRDDLGERFLRLANPAAEFTTLAEDCRQVKDGKSLEALALAMRRLEPGNQAIDYYLTLAHVWQKHVDKAVPFMRRALAVVKNQVLRSQYVAGFIQAMADIDKGAEAYSLLPDRQEAFRLVAAELKRGFRTAALRRVIAEHAAKYPEDPLIPYYRAEILVSDEEFAEAQKMFAQALAHPLDPVALEQFRASRVLARYHTGAALTAYRDIGPAHQTFVQLANLAQADRKHELLRELVAAHAAVAPNDPELIRHQIRVKIKDNQVADAVALFKKALAQQAFAEERTGLQGQFFYDMVDDGKALEAYQAAPDRRTAFQILGEDVLRQNKIEQFQALVEIHRKNHPGDVWVHFLEGEQRLRAGAWLEGAKFLQMAWTLAGKDEQLRFRFRFHQAMYKTGRCLEAYRLDPDKKAAFAQLASLCTSERDAANLHALVDRHRPVAGNDPDVLLYQARAHIFARKHHDALPLWQEAYRQQKQPFRRSDYVAQVVLDMDDIGLGLEAFRAAPDKKAAFETLARTWTFAKKLKELEQLVAECPPDRAADPWCLFYGGELKLFQGKPAEAEPLFAAARARAVNRDDFTFRNGLFRARVQNGKAIETYREFGGDQLTFVDLANACMAAKKPRELQALLAVHPLEKSDRAAWDVDLLWLQEDYAAVLALLDKKPLPARYRWKSESYQVRGLVKLNKTAEALQRAESFRKNGPSDGLLLVLAHAARGDVAKVIDIVDKSPDSQILAEDGYFDADLGPMLRGAGFGEFRKKYPEPRRGRSNPDFLDD